LLVFVSKLPNISENRMGINMVNRTRDGRTEELKKKLAELKA